MDDFEGRRVLVTGGSSGIGAALVHAFAAAGARVRSTGRDAARLEQVREETGAPDRVDTAVADLSEPTAARGVVHDAIEARRFKVLSLLPDLGVRRVRLDVGGETRLTLRNLNWPDDLR